MFIPTRMEARREAPAPPEAFSLYREPKRALGDQMHHIGPQVVQKLSDAPGIGQGVPVLRIERIGKVQEQTRMQKGDVISALRRYAHRVSQGIGDAIGFTPCIRDQKEPLQRLDR